MVFQMSTQIITESKMRRLETAFESIPQDYFNDLKELFQNEMSQILNGELKIRLVLDTNVVISNALSILKRGSCFLLNLMKSPFIEFVSPPDLNTELKRNEKKIAKNRKVPIREFRQAWKMIIEHVDIVDDPYLQIYTSIVQTYPIKDYDDAPYIALYFYSQAHGVATKNIRHFEGTGVRILNIGEAKEKVTIFQMATGMYFIQTKAIPTMLYLLYDLIKVAIAFVIELILRVVGVFYMLLSKGIEAVADFISGLPDWMKVALGVLAIYLIINNSEAVMSFLGKMITGIINFLNKLGEMFVSILDAISVFIPDLIDFLLQVHSLTEAMIERAITEINELENLRPQKVG